MCLTADIWFESSSPLTSCSPHHFPKASLDYINTLVGERLSADTVCALLERMQLSAAYDGARGKVVVQVPPTRSDILHACDIAEDVAIAYGYNKIRVQLPQVCAAGEPQPVGLLTELLRVEIAALGFSEVLGELVLFNRDHISMRILRTI